MNTSAHIEKDQLLIICNGEAIYSIAKSQLADTINLYGNKISKWIRQLLEKKWADNSLLYQIGYLIQQTYPRNEINWNSTFYMVEKKDYINKSFELKNNLENGISTKAEIDFLEYFKFANDNLNEEIEKDISAIVKQQLKQCKIIE